jgi:tetratricopeptide (TPR) repeat protein
MKLNKLSSALMVFTAVGVMALPVSQAFAAPDQAKIAERKAKKSQAVGEKVGKAIGKAYDLYGQNKVNEALALLTPLEPSVAFDRAYLYNFMGKLYAEKEPEKAISYLVKAMKEDVLGFNDQAGGLKLIGDLYLSNKKYQEAITYYNKWSDFTGETDPNVDMRIANCYYEMKQFQKVIEPADRAIAHFKAPRKEPYMMKVGSYYELKQTKKAIDVLETLVSVFPEEKGSWVQLANFYNLDEQYDRALAVMELAYKQGFLSKENEIKLLANLYVNNSIPYRAAEVLEKHLKSGLLKKERGVLSSIASSYSSARNFDKAAEYYGVLGQMENDGEFYRRQGSALLNANRNAEAVSALLKALEVGVKDKGKVHVDLISAYFFQGKMAEAYRQVELARKNGQEKMAASWGPYVKERAEKKGIKLN